MSVLLIAILLALAVEAEVSVTTLDGSVLHGTLGEWTSAELTLEVEGQQQTLAVDRLLAISWNQKPGNDRRATYLELTDGTKLPFDRLEVSDHQATFSTPLSEQPVEISTSLIRLIQFSAAVEQDDLLRQKLEEQSLAGDVLVIQKKSGGRFDTLTGVIGDLSSTQITFNWEGESIPIKRAKVAALAYYHAASKPLPEPLCRVSTVDGAQVPLRQIAIDGDALKTITPAGLELRIPLGKLANADFSIGKLVYLSDLQALTERWTPRIELPSSAEIVRQFGAVRRDQSFSGSMLSLRWSSSQLPSRHELRTYAKGLALRSRTELVYRVPRGMNRLVALAGIDPATAEQGHVVLEIYADDRPVWQREIGGDDPPVEIDVQVAGARRLRIVVDYGSNLDFGDRLHLVEARFSK